MEQTLDATQSVVLDHLVQEYGFLFDCGEPPYPSERAFGQQQGRIAATLEILHALGVDIHDARREAQRLAGVRCAPLPRDFMETIAR